MDPLIAYLGPEGSYSHAAALAVDADVAVGLPRSSIGSVFEALGEGVAGRAVVPVENSRGGSVAAGFEGLRDLSDPWRVVGEIQLQIAHQLIGCGPVERIGSVHSKPEVFEQCRGWLSEHLPAVDLVAAASTSRAVESVATSGDASFAAIGSELAARLRGLPVLATGLADDEDNITRFVVLGTGCPEPTGDDRSTVRFTTANEPGALLRVLEAFAEEGINLSHIDKRPLRGQQWTYTFFVDAEAHETEAPMVRALSRARKRCLDLRVLGSYARVGPGTEPGSPR